MAAIVRMHKEGGSVSRVAGLFFLLLGCSQLLPRTRRKAERVNEMMERRLGRRLWRFLGGWAYTQPAATALFSTVGAIFVAVGILALFGVIQFR
jgi:hypothetical protein